MSLSVTQRISTSLLGRWQKDSVLSAIMVAIKPEDQLLLSDMDTDLLRIIVQTGADDAKAV